MATVRSGIILISTWQSFFEGFNNPLITPYSETDWDRCVNIANIYDVKLQHTGGNCQVLKHGTQVYLESGYAGSGEDVGNQIIVGSDTDFIYFLIYGTTAAAYHSRNYLIVYDKIGDTVLCGGRGINYANSINTLPMVDENTSATSYYSSMLNYQTEPNLIDYTQQSLFRNSVFTNDITPHLLACTSLSFELYQTTIITFGAKNYYVVGTNSLLPMG